MAVLLRSARLLRFSPSGSLQIVGTKQNGPPLSLLYGGAGGGRTTKPFTRQVACGAGTAPRHVWPCASLSGTMRGYAVSTRQREDEASLGVRSKQAHQFDRTLAKLENSVGRTRRITKTQLAPAGPAPADPTPDGAVTKYNTRIFMLCKKKMAKEAYDLFKYNYPKDVDVNSATYDILIRSLLAAGSLEEALEVKDMAVSRVSGFQLSVNANSLVIITLCKRGRQKEGMATLKSMLQAHQVPTGMAITRLVQALAQGPEADVAAIQEVASLTKDFGSAVAVSSMLFPNNTALAHIRRGDVESAIEVLEAVYTAPGSSFPSMNFVFKKVLEENHDKAMDKLSAMAERLAIHLACYRPATDLFIALIEKGKVEDAKSLLARCNRVAEQKDYLISYLSQLSRTPGQVAKFKSLLSLIPDLTANTYTFLMKCHDQDNDLASAKALREQMQMVGVKMDELSLKRLAELYRKAGETVPYAEPPESFGFYAKKLKDRLAQAKMEE